MSPFVIFTITLIVIYLVYYSVLITRDLYGKKGDSGSEEEEFETFSLQEEEEAMEVRESENGFSLVPLKEQRKVSDIQEFASKKSIISEHTGVDLRGDKGMTTDTNMPRNTTPSDNQQTVSQRDSAMQDGFANSSNSSQLQKSDLPIDNVDSTQRKIDKVQEEMDVIDPIGNLTMSKEFFRELLLDANKEGSLFIKKTQVSVT